MNNSTDKYFYIYNTIQQQALFNNYFNDRPAI